jgi:hypothetical protein
VGTWLTRRWQVHVEPTRSPSNGLVRVITYW